MPSGGSATAVACWLMTDVPTQLSPDELASALEREADEREAQHGAEARLYAQLDDFIGLDILIARHMGDAHTCRVCAVRIEASDQLVIGIVERRMLDGGAYIGVEHFETSCSGCREQLTARTGARSGSMERPGSGIVYVPRMMMIEGTS